MKYSEIVTLLISTLRYLKTQKKSQAGKKLGEKVKEARRLNTMEIVILINCDFSTKRDNGRYTRVTHTVFHTQGHTHTQTHTHIHAHTHTRKYTQTHTQTQTHTHTHTHTRTHTHTHTHTHIDIYVYFITHVCY